MRENTILGIIILLALTVFIIILPSIYLASRKEGWVPTGTIPISTSDFEIVKASCGHLSHFEIQVKNTGNHIIKPRTLQWCLKRYAYQHEICYPVYVPIEPNETVEIKSSVSPPSKYFRVTVESMDSKIVKEYENLVTCEKV